MSQPGVISQTLHTAVIAGLETAINAALQLDPATRLKLQQLDQHVFLLHCQAPELSLYLIPTADEVRLCGYFDGPADTTLTGKVSDFAELASAADPANTLINGKLELHGDSQALITLQKILRQLDLDWEAPLADLFGDVVGHQLGRSLRRGLGFGLKTLRGFRRQVDDYIVEESELLPARWQTDQFFNEVDQLAMRSERLDAQLRKLRARLAQRTIQPNDPQHGN